MRLGAFPRAAALTTAFLVAASACASSGSVGTTEQATLPTSATSAPPTATPVAAEEDDQGLGLGLVGAFDLPGIPAAVVVDDGRDVGFLALEDGRILGFTPSRAAAGDVDSRVVAEGLEHPRAMAMAGETLVVAELGELPCPPEAIDCRGGDVADDPAAGDAAILAASDGRLTAFAIGADGSLGERRTVLSGLPVVGSDAGPRALAAGPDGSVYVSIAHAGPASLGSVSAIDHPSSGWLGTVLRVDLASGEAEVLASGVRRIEGLAVAGDGSVFGVDTAGPTLGGWRVDELIAIGEADDFGYPDDGTFGEWTSRSVGPMWVLDTTDPGPIAWGAGAGLGDVVVIGSCGDLEAIRVQPLGDTWYVRSPFGVDQVTRLDGCVTGVAAMEPKVVFASVRDGTDGRLVVLSPDGDPEGIVLGSASAPGDDEGLPLGLSVIAERTTTGAPTGIAVDLDRDLGYIAFGEGRIVRFRPSEMAAGVFEFERVANGLEYPRGLAIAGDLLAVTEMGRQVCDDPFPHCGGLDLPVDRSVGEVQILEASSGRLVGYAIGDDGSLSDRRVILDDLPFANSFHGVNDVEVGPDGHLYVALGNIDDLIYDRDLAESAVHHPNESLLGTVLRVDAATGEFDVFASGTRNLYGLAFAGDGSLWAAENDGWTWSTWRTEEVVQIEEGDDFGHPYEGTYGPWRVRTAPPVFTTDLAGSAGIAWGEDAGLGSTLLIGACGRLQALGLEKVGEQWLVTDGSAYQKVMRLVGCGTGVVVGGDDRLFVTVNSGPAGAIYVLGTGG